MSACFGMQATPDSYCAALAAFVRRISTPWLPSSYARLPHLLSGSSGFSTVSRFPVRSISAFRLPEARYEPFQCFLLAEPLKFGCLPGLQATPVPFQASNSASGPPPILHPAPTHSHWCFWLSPDSYPDPHQIPSPCGSSGFVGHLRNS
jgi:hypothetical protein